MKSIKYGTILAALLMVGNATAQEDGSWLKRNNAFVTAGVQTEAFMNNDGHILGAGKIGFGMWLKPWLGLKLEGIAGNTRLMEDSRGQAFGVQLSYMGNIIKGKDRYNTLGLNGIASIGYYRHKFGNILEKYTYMDMLTANFGLQGVYYINPNWNIYLEPSLVLQPKYYDVENKDDLKPGFMLTAGINFGYGKKVNKPQAYVQRKPTYNDIERLNERINEMKREIEELKKNNLVSKEKNIVVSPELLSSALSIKFDMMGAVLSQEEINKLKDVATWMNDHNTSVTVVPFADYKADDKSSVNDVKDRRFEAIADVLNKKFNIDRALIKKGNAEEMGYVNKYSQEALIIFNTK